MIKKENVIKIGQFLKPHGIKGEIAMSFTDDIFDRCDSEYIICEIDGILVPFFIEEYRFKNDMTALIKLNGIDTEKDAKEFTNLSVYYPKEYFDQEELENEYEWDYFIGFQVNDKLYGDVGVITAIDETTINVLFQVEKGGKELLIPAVDDFIVDMDHEQKILYVRLPEGLINLDNNGDIF